eukprot:GHVN01028976.1.p1 GENE.GHVN01028976.1~~GHVN01028976.1.p1  ORF type:complete len:226 (-),score=45.55 GHVN01028976.1:524-1201(-)
MGPNRSTHYATSRPVQRSPKYNGGGYSHTGMDNGGGYSHIGSDVPKPVTVYQYTPAYPSDSPSRDPPRSPPHSTHFTQSPPSLKTRVAAYPPQPIVNYGFGDDQGRTYVLPPHPISMQTSSVVPRQQIQGAHDNLKRVLDDNEALEVRMDRLQREATEMRSQCENLSAQVSALTQENSDLRDELGYYERARNHPLIGESLRSLVRNANAPPDQSHQSSKFNWCWT